MLNEYCSLFTLMKYW